MSAEKYSAADNSDVIVERAIEYAELMLAQRPRRLPFVIKKLREMRDALFARDGARATLGRLEAYIRALERRAAGK